jgi:hypothetical protein
MSFTFAIRSGNRAQLHQEANSGIESDPALGRSANVSRVFCTILPCYVGASRSLARANAARSSAIAAQQTTKEERKVNAAETERQKQIAAQQLP